MNTDEEDNSRSAIQLQKDQAEVDGLGVEPLQIPLEIPGNNEIDEREAGHEATVKSDSVIDKDNMNAGVEFAGLNEVGETETAVVADEGLDNSVMATEEVVTGTMDEPVKADEDKIGVEEGLKEEPTDVSEGTEITGVAENFEEVKEENENEVEVEEKKVEIIEESMLAEVEIAEKTEEFEEAKTADRMEEQETDVGNTADEMEVTVEAEEMGEGDDAEEMEGDNAEEIEEGDNTEKIEEAYNAEDIEEVEEGDNAENIEIADGTLEAAAEEVEEVGSNAAGKRKRGKNAKAPVRTPSRKKVEEDVCFVCFDGGELVLCDRRGCPKAYHPTCVNRDDAFFQARGRWNCGWHICSNCEKNAYYMCYTCTFSLCKGCVKNVAILCVRGNKGFCESCMKTVMLIERNEQGNKNMVQVDFDDRSSFEYLFKDYWVELKGKLSLTLDELSQAKNPWKGSEVSVGKQESRDELYDAHNDIESGSDDSYGNLDVNSSKRRRAKKRLKPHSKERDSKIRKKLNGTREALTDDSKEWASIELLEFVRHMKNGDRSVCTQFDVQALLLEYIKRNKLRDPRHKSQIICDSRLEKLFRKSRVGHFEMLKLLESHFLVKEDSHADDLQGSVVDTEANQSEVDGSDILMKGKDRRRKSRKKNDGQGLQSNVDDYAAIDTNNINLIYLRRSLVENLIDDTETFRDKVVGAFVRIRISGSAQKQDLYRLVQVVGTSKAADPYKVGKKTTEFQLEILNLSKTEIVSIDIISNQDFTEDECKRLRQSIKCGLINRLTVGDIQEKAMALLAVRVEDSLESEITRFNHLRDRASDMGRRKELRECVEKLQLLKSPGERQRRSEEIPEVHADPNMDPSYESEEDDEMDDKKQENSPRSGGSSFNRRGRDTFSPGRGNLASIDSWSGTRSYSSTTRELSRSLSNKGFSIKGDDAPGGGDMLNENEKQPQNRERPKSSSNFDNRSVHSSVPLESIPSIKQEIAVGPSVVPSNTKINEAQKIWHYKDPSGKIQGPFSVVQLRKWSSTGYFPADLRIWRATEKQDDSILLTDALAGNFQREPQAVRSQFEITNSIGRATPGSLEISEYSTDKRDSETNLPSPTPAQASRSGTKGQVRESRWSPTPVVGNGEIRHGALVMPQSGHQLSHTPIPSSSELPRAQATSNGASVYVAVDLKNLQNLVHPVGVTNPLVGTQGRGPVLAAKPEMGVAHNNSVGGSSQPSAYGGAIHNPASSFIGGNPTGPITGQPSVQPSVPSNAPWGMSVTNNQTTSARSGPENQNSGWGPIPGNTNMGWRGPVPTTSNLGWVGPSHPGPGPVPVNANPGWTGHGQGQAPAYPGWVPPAQGPGPVNNQGWVAPGQGNGVSSQAASKGNMGSGYGGGKPWNNQQSQSRGDLSRPPQKGQRVCKFHENGHCKKGAACDYLHS